MQLAVLHGDKITYGDVVPFQFSISDRTMHDRTVEGKLDGAGSDGQVIGTCKETERVVQFAGVTQSDRESTVSVTLRIPGDCA